MLRKVLLIAVVTVVVLFGGLLIAPSFVDWNVYKGQVTNQVVNATGRNLSIDGDLSLTLLPRPTLVASGVRVGNIEGAGTPDMIRLRTALVRVALTPLVRGQIAVESVVLVQPQISLERLADGRVNWAFSGPEQATPDSTAPAAPSPDGFTLPPIAFNDISIEDGTIVFRDAGTGDVRRFERINARIAAGSLQGPFRAEGTVSAIGVPFELRAEIGRLAEDRAIPVSAGVDMGNGGTTAEFSGVLSGFPIEPRLSGRVTGQGTGTAATLGSLFSADVPVLPDEPLKFAGDLTADPAQLAISALELSFGESAATGSIDLALEPKPAAKVAIGVSRLDLDNLLAPAADADGRADEAPSTDRGTAPIQVVPGARAASGFVLPQGVDLSIEAMIDAIIFRENIIRQTRLAAELTNGELTISQASAQLPGGADVTMFGFVMADEGGEPVFDGQIEANADNLRGLLSWLGVPTDTVPADRLRVMELAADIRATPSQITVSNTDAQLDLSEIRGGVAVALRERPGLGVGFSIDKLNLDAYRVESAPEATPNEARVEGAEEPDSEAPDTAGLDLSGLAFLDTFDSIMQFQVGSLTYKGVPIQGISFDGTLQSGNLELRQASVADLAGTSLSASGTLSALSSESPSLSVNVAMDSEDAGRFLDALGLDPPDRSGPVKIEAGVSGDAGELTIGADVEIQDLAMRADGTIGDLALNPTYDLRLGARHHSTADFVALFTGESASAGDPGELEIDGRLVGDLATAEVDLAGRFGEGQAKVSGTVGDLAAAPTADLQIDASHPELGQLIRLVRPDYRPALSELGEFRLTADTRYDPSGVTLSGLQGSIGPVALQGEATVALDGPRPRLVANLSTSEIVADWFLAPAAVALSPATPSSSNGRPAPAESAPRWSSEPLDLSALQAIDAEITVATPGLSYTGYNVEQPQINLSLNNGALALKQLSGKAFGGEFSMTADLDTRNDTASQLLLSVTDADAAKLVAATQTGRETQGASSDVVGGVLELLFPVSAIGLESGTVGAEFALATSGGSEFELVSNLNGSGEVSFSDAVLEGFSVCNLSAQLDDINGVESILGLALSVEGGTTAVDNFVGRFDIIDGVANLPAQQLNADCATAQLSGNVDLPRWLVDLRANVTFPQHPEFPGVVVEERGPLDAPNVRLVNLNQVQQYFVARAADTVLRKLVPDDIVEPAPAPVSQPAPPVTADQPTTAEAPAPEPAPEPEAPADPFIKLLDTLLQNR